jgi:hypothetical protein
MFASVIGVPEGAKKPAFRSYRCVRVQAGSRGAAVYVESGSRRKTQDSHLSAIAVTRGARGTHRG